MWLIGLTFIRCEEVEGFVQTMQKYMLQMMITLFLQNLELCPDKSTISEELFLELFFF